MKRATAIRNAAIEAGLTTYFTGRPCKHGHISPRSVANGTCIECAAVIDAKCREGRKGRIRETNRAYYAANAEKIRELNRVWREANPERMTAIRRAHYHANRPSYHAASSKRRAAKLTGTPPWVDLEAIAAVYAEAKRLTRETGIPHDVDHIVPLQGKNVCGLHVPWNLRPLPSAQNRAKQNKL